MKTTIKLLILCLTLGFFSGCTQPDGKIGDWFGSWYLEEMMIDGETDEDYASNKQEDRLQVMISFQSNVFNIGYLNGSAIYGTWSYAGEILTLIAGYNSGSGYNSLYFNPYPIVMHFPAEIEELEITVTKLTGRIMQWQHTDTQGRLITYNFRKYP